MKLGALEQKLMDHIWEQYSDQSFTVRTIVDDLHNQGDAYAYNTIQTVMTHLHEKELLSRTKEGKTCQYAVQLSQKNFLEQATQRFVERMAQQYGTVAIAHFANAVEGLDPKLLEQAQAELRSADDGKNL